MNSQEFMEDIKQLLQAEISGVVRHMDKRVDGLEQRMDSIEQRMATNEYLNALEQRIDAKFDTVLDAIGERADVVEVTQKDHEHRITRLEHHPA